MAEGIAGWDCTETDPLDEWYVGTSSGHLLARSFAILLEIPINRSILYPIEKVAE